MFFMIFYVQNIDVTIDLCFVKSDDLGSWNWASSSRPKRQERSLMCSIDALETSHIGHHENHHENLWACGPLMGLSWASQASHGLSKQAVFQSFGVSHSYAATHEPGSAPSTEPEKKTLACLIALARVVSKHGHKYRTKQKKIPKDQKDKSFPKKLRKRLQIRSSRMNIGDLNFQ